MIVIPLDSPPVGFRFSPTDEELVNHYLKGKINGRNRSELQVIPEIDVCKCEPWDVPDKSVIRSGDLEWFFFSPTDRKYPNGQRSNRATEAGYWKATGKNRFIKKSKCGGGSSAVIGMKKTLVFHTGRAPKGVRTSWIMHEYRATEAEFQSAVGDQGGYVLYRLFKKTEEKNESCNGDEIERSDLSPTPAKSSPGDTQYEADAFEELGAPLAVTPLNQVSGVSGLQEVDQQLLPYSIENQPSGITRWLANKTDSSSPNKAHGDNCRSHVVPEHEAERGALVDPLLDEFEHLYDPKDELSDFSGFPTINSPIRPYSNHPFSGNTDQKSHMGFYSSDHLQQDSIDEFLNSILSNQDGNPFEEPNVRPMATTEVVHNCCSSEIDTEVVEQGDVGMRDPGWFNMDTSIGYPEINCAFSDNQNVFPYESKMADVYSVDSGAESLQASVNSMQESNSHINAFSNGDDTNGTTAINLRSRLQQHPTQKVAFQGFANRRIRLQCYDEISAVSITESESSSNEEDNGEVASCNEHDEIPGSLIKLEKLSIHEDNAASSNIEELTPQLRLRTKSNISIIDSDIFKGPIPEVKTSRRDVAVNYAIKVFLIIMIMLMVCTGTLGWKKISNLWSGVGSL